MSRKSCSRRSVSYSGLLAAWRRRPSPRGRGGALICGPVTNGGSRPTVPGEAGVFLPVGWCPRGLDTYHLGLCSSQRICFTLQVPQLRVCPPFVSCGKPPPFPHGVVAPKARHLPSARSLMGLSLSLVGSYFPRHFWAGEWGDRPIALEGEDPREWPSWVFDHLAVAIGAQAPFVYVLTYVVDMHEIAQRVASQRIGSICSGS